MAIIQSIATCLRFENKAEEAVKFYTGIFKNSRILKIGLYGSAAHKTKDKKSGSPMTIAFELNGQTFIATNTCSTGVFNDSISLQVYCKNQDELDYYWETLSEGGDAKEQKSGWLKDKYGVWWQIVPSSLMDMITDQDTEKSQRVIDAMHNMKKIDINDLKRAYLGKSLH